MEIKPLEEMRDTISTNYHHLTIGKDDYDIEEVSIPKRGDQITIVAAINGPNPRTVTLNLMPPQERAANADWGGSYQMNDERNEETGTLRFSAEFLNANNDTVSIVAMKTVKPPEPPQHSMVFWTLKE